MNIDKNKAEETISSKEKILKDDGNEQLIQRTTVLKRDLNIVTITSDIIRKKITKKLTKPVEEHMEWKKFGKVANQKRGTLEPGIVNFSNEEIHIINRKRDIEQDLADKFKDNILNRKNNILKEIKDQKERENKEKLEAFSKSMGNYGTDRKQLIKRSRVGSIKVKGYNPYITPEKLTKIFEKVGKIKFCKMFRSYSIIRFLNTIHAQDAYDEFNNQTVDGCVLYVQVMTDDDKKY